MRIGIVSDPHGNVYGLEATLKSIGKVDLILCAGDLTGYYYWSNEVFELLERQNCHLIAGNHDVFLLRYLGYLEPRLPAKDEARIPEEKIYKARYGSALELTKQRIKLRYIEWLRNAGLSCSIRIGDIKITMFHGSPWNPLDEYIYPDKSSWDCFRYLADQIIILGHTHHPLVKHVGDCLIINPGSCGQPRDYDPRASYAMLDTDNLGVEIHRVDYAVEKVIHEVWKRDPHHEENAKILTRTRGSM